MDQNIWDKVVELTLQLSHVTYENLTKIIRLESTGSASKARALDDSNLNDIDTWMGGGTCFSLTWHLFQKFLEMGLKPRLVMGHKRKEKNIHCALILPFETDFLDCKEFLFDPGYLIFEPLEIPLPAPLGKGTSFFPLVPNVVQLNRPNFETLELWTGGARAPLKLRFEYPLAGVSIEEFKMHWRDSFYREMMNYPVLNRLDKERGIQYYYQKGNLVTRTKEGSIMEKIDEAHQVEKISEVFKINPEIVEKALAELKHSTHPKK